MKTRLLLMFIGLLIARSSFSQIPAADTLKFIFNDKEYDNIKIFVEFDKGRTKIEGIPGDRSDWTFILADSVRQQLKYMELCVELSDTLVHYVLFKTLVGIDTVELGSMGGFRPGAILTGRYMSSGHEKKAPFFEGRDYIYDYFFVEDMDPEFYAETYLEDFLTDLSGQERVAKNIEFIKKYPETVALIRPLYLNIGARSYTREDIAKIYDCFALSVKESYYGKKIHKYIADRAFEITDLPDGVTGINEPLIRDVEKYNLIVFSASWCAPCHKLIPILKQINKDLGEELQITYVSMDNVSTVPAWKKLLIKEEIPWRSLLAADRIEEIKRKYDINGIPRAILVYPGGKWQFIDVRVPSEKENLYRLVEQHK